MITSICLNKNLNTQPEDASNPFLSDKSGSIQMKLKKNLYVASPLVLFCCFLPPRHPPQRTLSYGQIFCLRRSSRRRFFYCQPPTQYFQQKKGYFDRSTSQRLFRPVVEAAVNGTTGDIVRHNFCLENRYGTDRRSDDDKFHPFHSNTNRRIFDRYGHLHQ